MDALTADEVFLFEGFRLDRRAGGLFRADGNGVLVPMPIGSRALDLLILLVGRQGDLVSKDEIMTAIWPGTVVEDSNLPTQISTLRRVLDRGRSNGSCIQTVAGRGYRFVAAVTHHPAREQSSSLNGGAGRAEDNAALLPVPSIPVAASRRRSTAGIAIAAAVGVALVSAGTAWWLWPTARPLHTREIASPSSMLQPLVAPRLSIVVLPFANLSDDREQQYFADGITDDLTTDLSRISDMVVISRNTAFTYRNKPVDTKQIGRELAVRYVLEGSVRRSANQIRINAQLIDAESDTQLWAESFNGDTSDLFALQDEIATRIKSALKLELVGAEAARPTEHPDALDYILRARAVMNKPHSREIRAEQMGGGDSRVRDGARAQSKFSLRIVRSRPVQALHWVDRGDYPAGRTSHPAQPPRSRDRGLVLEHRECASAAIAHDRGDQLVGKGAQPHSRAVAHPRLARLCLWPQRRDRTRHRRAHRSPQVERRRSFFEPRPIARSWRLRGGGTADPGPARSHLFRWSAQGRDAGGVTSRSPQVEKSDDNIPHGTCKW